MEDLSPKLATLVASRLCHDLVSPVGAISNGLELLALSGGSADRPELALINESCAAARARLNLYRVAFGNAEGEQMIGRSEATRLLQGYCSGSRLGVEWRRSSDATRPEVQLAMLAVLCCESALPQGGQVEIEEHQGGWRITGTGPRIGHDPALWQLLARPGLLSDASGAHVSGAQVHFPVLAALAARAGRRIVATAGDAAVTLELL